MCQNPQFPADLVSFTDEILRGKLHFLCCVCMRALYLAIKVATYFHGVAINITVTWNPPNIYPFKSQQTETLEKRVKYVLKLIIKTP